MNESIAAVFAENKSKYEAVALKHDPNYELCLKAVGIIKEFIKERGLIIYGGTAIDYALRLHGDKIYPDEELALPDLDFYSPDNVKDAYDLADILYKQGLSAAGAEIRAIRATFVKTMRVEVGNQFLADITYAPPVVFKGLPFLMYEGMKIIHPNYQRADMHIGLTYIYDGPPKEALFARWKFIKRLNLMDKYYPLPTPAIDSAWNAKKQLHRLPYSFTKYVFSGSAAYSLMVAYAKQMSANIKLSPAAEKQISALWKDVPMLQFEIDPIAKTLLLETVGGVEYVNFDMDLMAEEIGLIGVEKYADMGSFLPKHIFGVFSDGGNATPIKIYSSKGRYVSIGSLDKFNLMKKGSKGTESRLRFVGAQYLFSNLIANWMVTGDDLYLILYNSLMKVVEIMEKIIIDAGLMHSSPHDAATHEQYITKNPLLISTAVYGNENVSETVIVSLKQLAVDLKIPGVEVPKTPAGYYPSRKTQRRTPDFDYDSSELFIKDGRRIK